jgi:signal transduction histidine kinase/CheY-like chemotaxis protein
MSPRPEHGSTELSLRTRLVLLFAGLAAAVAIAPVVYLPRALEEQSRRWAERRCHDVARAVAGAAEAPLDFDDRRAAAEVLASLESTKGASHAILLRPDGTRLTSWREPPPGAPEPPRTSSAVVYGAGIAQVRVDVALPSGGSGALVVGFSLDELAERRSEAQELVARTSLFVLAAAILAAFACGTLLLRPLRRVIAVAARIARGDESATLDLGDVGRGGETGQVADALEVVVERLRRLNASLEQRVDERTRDLAAANAQLATRLAELKQTQAQLVVADRRLSLGRLAAGAAHEINNPLAYVKANVGWVADRLAEHEAVLSGGSAEDVARGSKELPELVDALKHAHDGASRIAHIVRGLKAFSQTDTDERASLRLDEPMATAIDMAHHELKHRTRLERDFRPTPLVDASSVRLTQVFVNLLVNAAQAMPEGAADRNLVRVTLGTDPEGWAFAEVSDTGSGIPPEVLDRLFEPFFTTKPAGQGTGLGLSISQGIVAALGGRITVSSEVGRGSTFRVTIPPLRGEPRAPTPPPLAAPPAPRRGRVLVVDDEPLVGAALRRVLSREHDVVVVTSGADALERMGRGERYDVILCDLVMPQMSGLQLAAELERIVPAQAQALLFMTGGAFTEATERFVGENSKRVLEKPVDPDVLRRHVHARLSA